jgi:hypothetical protein
VLRCCRQSDLSSLLSYIKTYNVITNYESLYVVGVKLGHSPQRENIDSGCEIEISYGGDRKGSGLLYIV